MLKKHKNISKNVLTNNGEIDIIKSSKETSRREHKKICRKRGTVHQKLKLLQSKNNSSIDVQMNKEQKINRLAKYTEEKVTNYNR